VKGKYVNHLHHTGTSCLKVQTCNTMISNLISEGIEWFLVLLCVSHQYGMYGMLVGFSSWFLDCQLSNNNNSSLF
jgi:hypothetical protein